MNNKSISARELRLMFVFFTLLILYLSYQFGYVKYTNKSDKLIEENRTLSNQLSELKKKDSNKDKYIKETEEFKQQKDAMLATFSGGFTEEKITMFVVDLENHADMHISSISFDDNQVFYSSSGDFGNNTTATEGITRTPETTELTEGVSPETSAEDGTTKEQVSEKTADVNITGYKTSVVLTYQATYAGLKKCIDYINNNKEKMNISDLTATFDSTTGNLSGTITITMYALTGANQTYIEPQIAGVKLGTDNIFGTFELPVNPDDTMTIETE